MKESLFLLEITPEFKKAFESSEPIKIIKESGTGNAYLISQDTVFSLMKKDIANSICLLNDFSENQTKAIFKHKIIPKARTCNFSELKKDLLAITPRDLSQGKLPTLSVLLAHHLVSSTELLKV